MTMGVDTRWFQAQLADRRLSQRKLASLMGLDPGAVSLALHGKRKLSAAEVADIARLLGVGVDEVMMHLGAGGHRERAKRAPDVATKEKAPQKGAGKSQDWESEFMAKWVELGMMLMRNRGP